MKLQSTENWEDKFDDDPRKKKEVVGMLRLHPNNRTIAQKLRKIDRQSAHKAKACAVKE